MPKTTFNPLSGKFDLVSTAADFAGDFVKLDQTSPQSVINGRVTLAEGFKLGTTPTVGSFEEGKIFYDVANQTVSAMIDGNITMQIGQEELTHCMNDTLALIPNGSVVYVTGANGDKPTIDLAKADSAATSTVLGMTTQDIGIGASGYVTVRGIVHDVNTLGMTAGQQLYLSDTVAGAVTTTQVINPLHFSVKIGNPLLINATTGSIYICLIDNNRLTELDDVTVIGLANGDVLEYSAGVTSWINSPSFTNHLTATNNPHATSDANLVTSNITTNNVSITKHGFAPILSNNALQFLNGQGNYAIPTAGVANSYSLTTFSGQITVNVVHNFGTYPNVQVIDNTGAVIVPLSITNNTLNDFTVVFSVSTSGSIIATVGSPQPQALTVVSGDYVILLTDRIIKETGAAKTITLPTAVGNTGREFIINNASGGNLTVNTTSSQLINNALAQLVPSQSSMTVYSDGSGYNII